ncbi:MAG: DUF934 domain-containing protein [Moraxella sp.]|nr:DUF934 domain-containing protein [Moraxella sp.]
MIVYVDKNKNLDPKPAAFYYQLPEGVEAEVFSAAFEGFSVCTSVEVRGVIVLKRPEDLGDEAAFSPTAPVSLLLTADDTADELSAIIAKQPIANVVIYVADFKDGRVFSLVRGLRLAGFAQDILVAGKFGFDQASYFYKSGVSGFVIAEDKLELLSHTLGDLKTAYEGRSVKRLPLFS